MAYQLQYQIECKNFEQQLVKALIEDTTAELANPYGLAYTLVDDPGPTQTLTVTFTSTPPGCSNIRIDARDSSGALVGSSGVVANASPLVWNTCPDGSNLTFIIFFYIPIPPDDGIVLNDLAGITYDLTPSDNPFRLIADNTSDSKLGGIIGHQLKMEFKSDTENNLNKLLRGSYSDRRYKVTATINDRTFFKGFLQMADGQEPFLPHPNTIALTATCGLATLKNKTLKDFNDENPSGYFSIIKYVAWCLRQTGITGNINVSFRVKETDFAQFANSTTFTAPHTITFHNCFKNLYAGQKLLISGTANNNGIFTINTLNNVGFDKQLIVDEAVVNEGPDPNQPSIIFYNSNFFNSLFLESKTFEDEPGSSLDCYTVLQSIANMYFRIGQRHGEWWIKCIDEYDDGDEIITVFDEEGEFIEVKDAVQYKKTIGRNENMKWSGHSAIVAFTSPALFSKLTYRFENPKEVPCNVDFERGDFISDIDSDSKKFDIECWDKHRESFGGGDGPPTADIFIQRNYVNGYENERYVVFQGSVGNFIKSEAIPVKAKDKFTVAVTRRMSADVGGSGFFRDIGLQVRLYASDGTYYVLEGETSGGGQLGWRSTNASFNSPAHYFYFEGDASADQTEPQSLYGNTDSPPIPKSGYIYLCVHQSHMTSGSWPGKDTYIDKVEFELLHYINGSYQKYTGQYHKLSVTSENIEKVDEEVKISDAPGRLLKGALHKWNGSDYLLAQLYWNEKVDGFGPGTAKPFGWHQAQAVWNQVRTLQRIFRGRVQGIESDSVDGEDRCDLPTVFHNYELSDQDEQTSNKIFMKLSFDMDLYRCEFSQLTLKESYDSVAGKKYDDTYEFKYLTR